MPRALIVNHGDRFGRLTIIKEMSQKNKPRRFLCECECGNQKVVSLSKLRTGNTKSCGCLQKEVRESFLTITHGQSNTRIYNIWAGMKDRCLSSNNPTFKHYGGRGIKICDAWLNFEPFYKWALQNGYHDNLSIERINNNGNYEPNNCEWATQKKQSNNTRRSKFIEFNGQKKTIKEWAEHLDIKYLLLYKRLSRGWSIEKAFYTPSRSKTP